MNVVSLWDWLSGVLTIIRPHILVPEYVSGGVFFTVTWGRKSNPVWDAAMIVFQPQH